MSADCLVTLLDAEDDDESRHARALTGALLVAEGLYDLRLIRKALTKKEK